jgi:hypothetical protein
MTALLQLWDAFGIAERVALFLAMNLLIASGDTAPA